MKKVTVAFSDGTPLEVVRGVKDEDAEAVVKEFYSVTAAMPNPSIRYAALTIKGKETFVMKAASVVWMRVSDED